MAMGIGQDSAHRAAAGLDGQLLQLPNDASSTPARIFPGQPKDQFAQ